MRQDYYEAILQLRPKDEELINYVENQIKKRGDVFVSKAVQLANGIDLYLSSQRFAIALGRKLKRVFKNSEINITRSIYKVDRMTSKKKYRVTVLLRLKKDL